MEQTARSAESALKAVQHELELERGKERERDEKVRAFQQQRDTVQRERAKLQEQCSLATAEARAASEREHALFIRTTVLEQQVLHAARPPTGDCALRSISACLKISRCDTHMLLLLGSCVCSRALRLRCSARRGNIARRWHWVRREALCEWR